MHKVNNKHGWDIEIGSKLLNKCILATASCIKDDITAKYAKYSPA